MTHSARTTGMRSVGRKVTLETGTGLDASGPVHDGSNLVSWTPAATPRQSDELATPRTVAPHNNSLNGSINFNEALLTKLDELRAWVVSEQTDRPEQSPGSLGSLSRQGSPLSPWPKGDVASRLLVQGPRAMSGHHQVPAPNEPETPRPLDAEDEDNGVSQIIAHKWMQMVSHMNSPAIRVAVMKKYVTLPIWGMAIRQRNLEGSFDVSDAARMRPAEPGRPALFSTFSGLTSTKSFGQLTVMKSRSAVAKLKPKSWIMHPESYIRIFWNLLALLLTMYDAVMMPIFSVFNIDEDLNMRASSPPFAFISWFSLIFWSLDIAANFMTGTYIEGVLHMRAAPVAVHYVKGWLMFDLLNLVSQWLTAVLHSGGDALGIVVRLLRLLRVSRVFRLGWLENAFEMFMSTHHAGMMALGAMVKIIFVLAITIHVHGCLWYGVGRVSYDGWAYQDHVKSRTLIFNYIVSVQWAVAQVNGTSRSMALTTFEHTFAALSLCFGVFMFTYVLANATLTVMQFNHVNRWKMQATCTRFCESNKISTSLSARVQHYLFLNHRKTGLSEKVKEDAGLLLALPPSVRVDVIDEARLPLLRQIIVFSLMHNFNSRTVRKIGQAAVTVWVALAQEVVFAEGDTGKNTFIVQFGRVKYNSGVAEALLKESTANKVAAHLHDVLKDALRSIKSIDHNGSLPVSKSMSDITQKKRMSIHPVSGDRTSKIRHAFSEDTMEMDVNDGEVANKVLCWGDYVGEAVLWTMWEHIGDLWALCDSTLFVLDPDIFTEVVKERNDVFSFVASYARKFVSKLNQAHNATDLFHFQLEAALTSEEDPEAEGHLIFLSHYKAEAGTEATLMQEELTRMISMDAEHSSLYAEPVFLDSEGLTDLRKLGQHVAKSTNLVLLLTPGVLSRPWCLVEIAIALQQNIRIVPVEVQRPGISFKYPDESFYQRLTTGNFLSEADQKVLRNEDLSMAEVERGIRNVFLNIALPFSPHRSAQIRKAELEDILSRCTNKAKGPASTSLPGSERGMVASASRRYSLQ